MNGNGVRADNTSMLSALQLCYEAILDSFGVAIGQINGFFRTIAAKT